MTEPEENELKTVLTPPWKELVKIASGWEEDVEVHTHEEIAGILGVDYGTSEYYANVNAANDDLTELGLRLKNVHDEGYRVLRPEEQTPEAVYDFKGIMRKSRKVLWNLHCVPTKNLDDTNKERHERVSVSLGGTIARMGDGYSEAALIAGIKRPQKVLAAADKKRRQ